MDAIRSLCGIEGWNLEGRWKSDVEFKIYGASLDFFSFAHMRIGWDVARAGAGEERFGAVLVSGCLTACSGTFASTADQKKRDREIGRVGNMKDGWVVA